MMSTLQELVGECQTIVVALVEKFEEIEEKIGQKDAIVEEAGKAADMAVPARTLPLEDDEPADASAAFDDDDDAAAEPQAEEEKPAPRRRGGRQTTAKPKLAAVTAPPPEEAEAEEEAPEAQADVGELPSEEEILEAKRPQLREWATKYGIQTIGKKGDEIREALADHFEEMRGAASPKSAGRQVRRSRTA